MHRFGQYSLSRPTFPGAVSQDVVRHPCLFGPVAHRKRSALECYESRSPRVPVLLASCCPSAIAWFVIAVIVWVAIKTVVFTWALAHISQECLKRIGPSSANLDASSAIAGVPWIFRIGTSRLHAQPSVIFWRFRHAVRGVFSWPASTTQQCVSAATTDISRSDPLGFAAVTTAKPLNNYGSVGNLLSLPAICDNNHAVSARSIFESCHPACYTNPNFCWEI